MSAGKGFSARRAASGIVFAACLSAAFGAGATPVPFTAPLPVAGGDLVQLGGIAGDPSGQGLIVSYDFTRQLGEVQHFNVAGNVLGPTIDVAATNAASALSVAQNASGQYVVAWAHLVSPSGTKYDIYAQTFSASDAQGSSPVLIASNVTDGTVSSVAMDGTGNFFVTWIQDRSFRLPCQDCTNAYEAFTVWTRSYKFNGQANSAAISVARTPYFHNSDSFYWTRAETAVDSAGNFLVAWNYSTYKSAFLVGQHYGLDGSKIGVRQQLASGPFLGFSDADISANATGSVAAAWVNGNQVNAQLIAANGSAVGAPVVIQPTDPVAPRNVKVSMAPSGDFVVSWTEEPIVNQTSSSYYAQWFDSAAQPKGSRFTFATGQRTSSGTMADVSLVPLFTDASDHLVAGWTYDDFSSEHGFVQAFTAP